jgi:hypothetical protein
MFSAFKYRLYPKHEQKKRLNRSLLSLCDLYNNLKALPKGLGKSE